MGNEYLLDVNYKIAYNAIGVIALIVIGILMGFKICKTVSNKKNQDIMKMLYIDPVTMGSNYLRFKIDVEELFRKNPNGRYVVFYSDIRNFKYINDVYGFEMGNKILKRYNDLIGAEKKLAYARINADNFVSIEACDNETEQDIIQECLKRIERVSNVGDVIKDMPVLTVSVGAYCTMGNNKEMSIDSMIDRANLAQKQLKTKREAGCMIYCEQFRDSMLEEQEMENQMWGALEQGEFVVYLQPKVNLQNECVEAAEALVRWNHPDNGLIPPGKFIPLFERNGFIRLLDTYMFEEVCKVMKSWIQKGYKVVPISVNVSKAQLHTPAFLEQYVEIKNKYNIPNGLVEIEFTESVLFDNHEKMTEVLEFFRLNGFLSAIDDFGAGYSSLNLLKNLPTDIIKLDKMFFDENDHVERQKVIIKNVVCMAQELSMQTVAEGVESREQVEFLKTINCKMVQGFVFDRPQPTKEFERKYCI